MWSFPIKPGLLWGRQNVVKNPWKLLTWGKVNGHANPSTLLESSARSISHPALPGTMVCNGQGMTWTLALTDLSQTSPASSPRSLPATWAFCPGLPLLHPTSLGLSSRLSLASQSWLSPCTGLSLCQTTNSLSGQARITYSFWSQVVKFFVLPLHFLWSLQKKERLRVMVGGTAVFSCLLF